MTREVLLVAAVALLAGRCSAQEEAPRLERTLGSTRWRSRWSGASDVVVMPDGQRVLRAAMSVVLADLATGRELRTFRAGLSGRMGGEDDYRLALSRDGAFLAVVGSQAPVVVHAVTGDHERAGVELPTALCGAIAAAFTPDGAQLLVLDPIEDEGVEGTTLRTFAVGTWAEGTPRALPGATWGLAVGPDGALATHGHAAVALLDGPAPRVVELGEHAHVLGCFFLDATTLFVVDAGSPSRVLRVDVARAAVTGEWEPQDRPRAFAVGPGLLALAQSEGPLEVHDLEGKLVARLVGHTTPATALAFSPDGRRLVSVTSRCDTRVWDVAAEREEDPFVGHSGSITRLAWTADGKLWSASSWDETSRAWDVSTGQQVDVRPATWVPVPGRGWLHYYGMAVELKPAAEGGPPWRAFAASDLAVLPDGDVVLAQPAGVARFAPPATEPRWRTAWDLPTAARPKLIAGAQGELVVVWIPGEARVLDATSGALVARLELELDVEPTDLLGRDTLLASSRAGQAMAFALGRPGPPRDLGRGHGARASPDGRLLARVGAGGGVEVVEPTSDRRWYLNASLEHIPMTLAWSPDGQRLAVGHDNGLITVWTRPR